MVRLGNLAPRIATKAMIGILGGHRPMWTASGNFRTRVVLVLAFSIEVLVSSSRATLIKY